MRPSTKGQSGFSLIGVVILGITILLVGAGMFRVFINQSLKNKAIGNHLNVAMLAGALSTVLFDPPLCTQALHGQSSALHQQISIGQVSINGFTGTFQQGASYTLWQPLQILSVQFVGTGPADCNTGPTSKCPNDYQFLVEAKVQQPQQITAGPRIIDIPIVATVSNATISNCQSMSMTPSDNAQTNYDLCTLINGTWSGSQCHMPGATINATLFPNMASSGTPMLTVLRNGSKSLTTAKGFTSCALSTMIAGGENFAESCQINDNHDGTFTLSASVGNNPLTSCQMSCIQGTYNMALSVPNAALAPVLNQTTGSVTPCETLCQNTNYLTCITNCGTQADLPANSSNSNFYKTCRQACVLAWG